MALVTIPHVEIARVGDWRASTGPWNCTRQQIADAERAYAARIFGAPIMRRGHTDERFNEDVQARGDGEPALGILRNVVAGNGGNSLFADLRLPSDLAENLPAIYPHRSIEADLGVTTADGQEFAMVVKGLALLGETPPAITSLEELPDAEEVGQSVEYIAASSIAASIPLAAGFFDEAAHPRGGKGTSAGGKFVAAEKGDGYKGKEGEAANVKAIQVELLRLGLLSPDSGKHGGKDGLFGPKTEAAVKKWQVDHGQTPTGKVSDQLLKTLKLAKKGDKGEAQKLADHPKTPEKKPGEKPVSRGTAVLRHTKLRAKAAADAAAPDGLDVREITSDTVVYDDADGRVWVAPWNDDGDTATIGETAPAVVTYTRLAASAAALAAHALHSPLQWARGWEPSIITASEGDTELDITPKLREALGIDENADEAAVLAAIEGLKTPAEPPANAIQENAPVEPVVVPAAPADPSGEVNAQSVESVEALVAAKVAAALAPIQASHAVYESKIADLSGWKAERLAQEVVTTKTSVINAAAQQGKFTPAERATWEAEYDKAPDTVTRILASMKPGTAVPVAASGYAGDGTETGSEVDSIFAEMGWS